MGNLEPDPSKQYPQNQKNIQINFNPQRIDPQTNNYEQLEYVDEKLIIENVDRRKFVTGDDITQYPHNCVGLIISQSLVEFTRCQSTGVLISSCLVLSTAHSFIDESNGQMCELRPSMFYLGINGRMQEQKGIKILDYRVNKQYKKILHRIRDQQNKMSTISSQEPSKNTSKLLQKTIRDNIYRLKKMNELNDYALLKLQKIVQRQQYPTLSPQYKQPHQSVTVCGYDEDYRQYTHSNTLHIESPGGSYSIDTRGGQSGSMVYLRKQKHRMVGIHKGYDNRRNRNTCTMITREMVAQLQKWMIEMNFQTVLFRAQGMGYQYLCQSLLKLQQQNQQQIQREKKQSINKSTQSRLSQRQQRSKASHNVQLDFIKVQQYSESSEVPSQLTFDYNNDHIFNPDAWRFTTELVDNRLVINFQEYDGGWARSFIKNGALPKKKVSVYRVKQKKTINKCIMTGIGNETIIGKQNGWSHVQCVCYYSYNGRVWKNGTYTQMGRGVNDGEVITVEVDTLNWTIKWSIGEQILALTGIPQQMRSKELYLVILMTGRNDVVELFL